MGFGETEFVAVRLVRVHIKGNDVEIAGEEMGTHFRRVGGKSEFDILLERVAEYVQQLVLKADSSATIEEIVGRVAEQQDVQRVSTILHIYNFILLRA